MNPGFGFARPLRVAGFLFLTATQNLYARRRHKKSHGEQDQTFI